MPLGSSARFGLDLAPAGLCLVQELINTALLDPRSRVPDLLGSVESAQACGLHLLTREERNPNNASSYGLGLLLTAQLFLGEEVLFLTVLSVALFSVGYAIRTPWRCSSTWTNWPASISESCVPVSSQAVPRPRSINRASPRAT